MRILIVVFTVAIMTTPVFAEEVVWESGQPDVLVPQVYTEEGIPAFQENIPGSAEPQVGTQGSQEHAPQGLPLRSPPPPDAKQEGASNGGDAKKEEELQILRAGNRIQRKLVRVGRFTGWSQILLAALQFAVAGAAVYIARQSVKVADRSLRVANRAYLFVKEWQVVDFGERVQTMVRCYLRNAGHTPALLEKKHVECRIGKETPPDPLTPRCLHEREQSDSLMSPQGEIVTTLNPFSILPDTYQALENKTQFLYVGICFVYRDVFDQQWWVVSSGRYNVASRTFSMIDGPGYNCTKPYHEKDWK